jgi:hypothetical protein
MGLFEQQEVAVEEVVYEVFFVVLVGLAVVVIQPEVLNDCASGGGCDDGDDDGDDGFGVGDGY